MAEQTENAPGVDSAGDEPQMTPEEEAKAARAANRFDIRRLIGGLFLLYGVVLTVVGIVGSARVKHLADGVNVNLWTGLGMIVFGALMVFWALKRPVAPDLARGSRGGDAPAH